MELSTDNRYCPPTKLTKMDYKSLVIVHNEDGGLTIFIQCSPDIENPKWVLIGDVLQKAFASQLHDPEFLEECLRKYHG